MGRYFALAVGVAALALACFDAFASPILVSPGMAVSATHGTFIVSRVQTGGPAQQAGIRVGDSVDLARTSLVTRLCLVGNPVNACAAERPVSVFVATAGGDWRRVTMVPHVALATSLEKPLGRYLDLALAFLYVGFGVLIMLRSAHSRLAGVVVWLMMLYALTNGTADYNAVAPTTLAQFAINFALQQITLWAIGALFILAVAILCSHNPRTARALRAAAVPIGVLASSSPYVCNGIGRAFADPWLMDAATFAGVVIFSVVACVVVGVALFAVVSAVPLEERVRARWFVSTIAVCYYFGFAAYSFNETFSHWDAVEFATFYLISFALVGPVYATLRHRLIDLDVALSRSAVLAVVSAFLLIAFIAAEWIASKLSDAVAGEGRWHGLTAQLLSFGAAVAVGLWIRHLHARTERSVNAIVFRDRERRLRLLWQFAREADVVDERGLLLKVTFDALSESLETRDYAIYLADGDGFACVRTSNADTPERLGKGDRPILKLLRDGEPFANESEPLRGWLIVPLPARMDVIGFFACGAKRDHTAYLGEEIAALQSVGQHVGTSLAMLPASPQGVAL